MVGGAPYLVLRHLYDCQALELNYCVRDYASM